MLAFWRKLLHPRMPSRRVWVALAIVLIGLGLHAPVLRALAWPLIANEPAQDASYLCLHGTEHCVDGDDAFDRAADWYHEDSAREILVLDSPPSRLVEIGALPSLEQRCRRELVGRRVPDEAIQRLAGRAIDDWDGAHVLADWLRDHPAARIALVCSRFNGGRLRYVVGRVMEQGIAARIRIVAPPTPHGVERNWWRSRDGVKDFMFAWLGLVYAWSEGENRLAPQSWTIAEYQAMLRETFGEAPP